MKDEKEPLWVHCADEACGYEFAPAFVPMEAGLLAQVLKGCRCPRCGNPKQLMGQRPKPTGDGDWRAWMRNGDTGVSSETIWSVLSGSPVKSTSVPWDPSDFGRCHRLLKVMPSWRGRLGEVAAAYPAWAPLVAAWDELTALYEYELEHGPMEHGYRMAPKTYDRMKELLDRKPRKKPSSLTLEIGS